MKQEERLTERDEKGVVSVVNDCAEDKSSLGYWMRAINKLAELEDKIENGTLVELPCKVGDTIFTTSFIFSDGWKGNKMIHENGWKVTAQTISTKEELYKACALIGKGYAFKTEEAAKARLKELRGEK